jgi:murein DD-endopeptidase MepM/ murein hydrolase activator NlpD
MASTTMRRRGAAALLLAAALGLPAEAGRAAQVADAIGASRGPAPALALEPVHPVQPGDVTLLRAHAPVNGVDALTSTVFGQEVRFFPEASDGRWLAVLGVDLDVRPGMHPVTVASWRGTSRISSVTSSLEVRPKRFPTRRLRVASRFVEPPADETARILREAERLTAIFAAVTPRRWNGPFGTPIPTVPNSNFGVRSVFNGQPRNPHAGVDFAGPTGTPVAAPNGGIVALAEPLYFTGNTVILDHGLGLYSLYAHLSRIDVVSGGSVAGGDVVGLLGATGRVTGPHLHWAIRLNGARVDPLALVTALRGAGQPPSAPR